MSPRIYNCETIDGRTFTVVAGSDHGAIRAASERGRLLSLARQSPRGSVPVTIDRRGDR